jgi:hypothetical protein
LDFGFLIGEDRGKRFKGLATDFFCKGCDKGGMYTYPSTTVTSLQPAWTSGILIFEPLQQPLQSGASVTFQDWRTGIRAFFGV